MKLKLVIISCLFLLVVSLPLIAQEEPLGDIETRLTPEEEAAAKAREDSLAKIRPPAPVEVSVYGHKTDSGEVIVVDWKIRLDYSPDRLNVTEYSIQRSRTIVGPFEERGIVPADSSIFIDIRIDPEDSTEVMQIIADSGRVTPPAPPMNVTAEDRPNDHGHGCIIRWEPSPDDDPANGKVFGYYIFRADTNANVFKYRGLTPPLETSFTDIGGMDSTEKDYMPDHVDYFYKVRALTELYQPGMDDYYYRVVALTADTGVYSPSGFERFNGTVFADSDIAGPVQSYGQWFNWDRLSVLFMVVGFLGFTLYFISRARRGVELFVRRLAGIEAVDEAIGRATEMGKPILYVLGLGTAADIATIASYTILGRVAKKVAEYQTGLIVPCYDPIVMTVAQETVRTSYFDAGRPDAYDEDMVYFVTNQQFAYVAAVNGVMLRDRPATNLYMGKFYAESLILAETGAVAGSIQISGTDEISQIPFFVVACDYTLIGEELYAASAYLGREPVLLGTLKAQDYGKAAVIILTLLGFLGMSFGWEGMAEFFHVTN